MSSAGDARAKFAETYSIGYSAALDDLAGWVKEQVNLVETADQSLAVILTLEIQRLRVRCHALEQDSAEMVRSLLSNSLGLIPLSGESIEAAVIKEVLDWRRGKVVADESLTGDAESLL